MSERTVLLEGRKYAWRIGGGDEGPVLEVCASRSTAYRRRHLYATCGCGEWTYAHDTGDNIAPHMPIEHDIPSVTRIEVPA